MLQGIVFHALLPFHEAKRSPVSNPDAIVGVAAVTEWLHAFRMHGFFLISGILSWQLLCRVGTTPFLRSRLQRIVVPLVVVLLTVNVAERFIVVQHHVDWGWGLTVVPTLYLGALWFLVYLACFTTTLPMAGAVLQSPRVERALDGWSPEKSEYALPILLALGSMLVVLLALTSPRWWQTDKLGLLQPVGALLYSGYFAAGVFLARTASVSMLTSRPHAAWWVATVLGWAVIQWLSSSAWDDSWHLRLVLENVYALAPLRLIFWGVSALVRTERAWSTAIVGASYTVYLLHQVVIKATASSLAWLPWHPLLKVPVIVCFGFAIPFGVHQLFVRKSRWLSFLLNGVSLPPTRLTHAG